MFTGIVREIGTVEGVERSEEGARLRVRAGLAADLTSGDSVSVSGASRIEPTSRESSGRRASESKTTRAGWRGARWADRSTGRAVSNGSSASAVPIPTQTASHSARQR